ncbi:hypothetical protein DPV78_011764 [Talaromyces pinophilus]|nr:hypothetical protein DPV78_011764 [Talaromyces pinophilus]
MALSYKFRYQICSQLRTGDYVFIEGRPCQIIGSTISEGNEKVLIRGINLFSEVQREGTYHLTETMNIPIVSRTVCRLVSELHIFNAAAKFLERLAYIMGFYNLSCQTLRQKMIYRYRKAPLEKESGKRNTRARVSLLLSSQSWMT